MLSAQEVDKIIEGVIQREGGYVWDPRDPGGETKYGISKRSYPEEDIRHLTLARATALYRRDYADKFRIGELDHYRVAECVMDWVVHSGSLGIKQIQRGFGITADGIVGPETLAKLKALDDHRVILRWRLNFLLSLTRHPFIKGWVNRLFDLGL